MAKVRRTKIIIEEVVGEDEGSTKVFVNGDQFKEIDFTNEKKDSKEKKKKTTSNKRKTSSYKSSTSTKKKATSSKKKTTSSSKKTSTKSKTSSKKKTPSTSTKKDENKKEVQETQTTSFVIELPLKEEKKEAQVDEQISSNTTKDSGFVEISVKNEDKIIENAVPATIEENGVSLVDKEENNKEVIDNPEVIDGEIKATNEVERKGKKPETLEAEIVKKEEKDEEISSSEESEKDSIKSESDTSSLEEENKTEETSKEENIGANKISEPSKDKDEDDKDIKENDIDQIEEANDESNKYTSKQAETKEENASTTYTVKESNDSDTKEEPNKEESKISKLFSTKGLIVGGVILVALLAILIPVSLNLSNQSSNNHLIEINKEDINKNNFISSSAFFDNLESLELDIYDIRSTTTSLKTSLNYSYINEIYSFELTNEIYYIEEETINTSTDKLTYNQNEDTYTLTTTVNGESLDIKDQTKTYTKNQAKEILQGVINNFYSNYLNCDGSSINALIDEVTKKEESTLKYYYHDEANTYQIRDSSNSLLIVFDEYGIIQNADYSHPGWCLQETPSEPGIKYYTLNLSYTLKMN